MVLSENTKEAAGLRKWTGKAGLCFKLESLTLYLQVKLQVSERRG